MNTQKEELQYAVKQYLKTMMIAILSGIVWDQNVPSPIYR